MLYTGKGDKGDTYFFGSKKRESKASCQTEALGALDEINTFIGICRSKSKSVDIKIEGKSIPEILQEVQQNLFIIQAAIAGADKKITQDKITEIGALVNSIEGELPPIKTFFLSGSMELSSFLDYARAISRKTERRVVEQSEKDKVAPEILSYLNRLSSLLYALVRIVNFKSGAKETPPTYE